MNRLCIWLMACGGTLAVGMSGAQAAPHDWLACRAIADAAQRLACYDAVQADAPGPAAPAAAPRSPAAAPAAPAAPPSPTSGATTAPPAATAAGFGLDSREPGRLEEISTRLSNLLDGWDAQTHFQLANGQVWRVTDGSRGVYALDRPAVRIRRALLGSYLMDIEGVNQVIRVRRVR